MKSKLFSRIKSYDYLTALFFMLLYLAKFITTIFGFFKNFFGFLLIDWKEEAVVAKIAALLFAGFSFMLKGESYVYFSIGFKVISILFLIVGTISFGYLHGNKNKDENPKDL